MKLCTCNPWSPDARCAYGTDLFYSLHNYNINSTNPELDVEARYGMRQMYQQTTKQYMDHAQGKEGCIYEAK